MNEVEVRNWFGNRGSPQQAYNIQGGRQGMGGRYGDWNWMNQPNSFMNQGRSGGVWTGGGYGNTGQSFYPYNQGIG